MDVQSIIITQTMNSSMSVYPSTHKQMQHAYLCSNISSTP